MGWLPYAVGGGGLLVGIILWLWHKGALAKAKAAEQMAMELARKRSEECVRAQDERDRWKKVAEDRERRIKKLRDDFDACAVHDVASLLDRLDRVLETGPGAE